MTPDLVRRARELQATQGVLERDIKAYVRTLEPLPTTDLFWQHARKLLTETHTILRGWGCTRRPQGTVVPEAIRIAAEELGRLSAVRQGGWEFPTFLRFARGYDLVKSQIMASLENAHLGRSDDSLGDLADALPLAGPTLAMEVLRGKYSASGDDNWLVPAVTRSLELWLQKPPPPWLVPAITEGENYVELQLTDAAVKYLGTASLCRENLA